MSNQNRTTIIVNQKPFHLESTLITAAAMRELVETPDDYEVWQIVKSPDPEGPLPLDDVMIIDSVEVKSGDRFRVVPPGTFGAVGIAPKQLSDEVESLRGRGFEVELIPDNNLLYHIIRNYHLPAGYNKPQTNLLLKIPASYPNGSLDMFWTEPDLRLQTGNTQEATSEEEIQGQRWLRFSWHPKNWNPGADNLITYLEFINRRLKQLK